MFGLEDKASLTPTIFGNDLKSGGMRKYDRFAARHFGGIHAHSG